MGHHPVFIAHVRPQAGDIPMEAGHWIPTDREERKALRQSGPQLLYLDHRPDVAVRDQRYDQVAEDRQPRRRSLASGKTILIQFRDNLRKPDRVGTPITHETAQGVDRVHDAIPWVPGRAADVPPTYL